MVWIVNEKWRCLVIMGYYGLVLCIWTVILLIIFIIHCYNSLVRKRNYIVEAWASIDVQLKKKANVLTNVVETLRLQTSYEKETLANIMSMRDKMLSSDKTEAISASDKVSKMMAPIFGLAENYPQLQANAGFLKLMDHIKDVEEKIAYARNRYNVSVMNYNSCLQVFPKNIFAKLFGFKPERSYEISDVEREYSDNLKISDL